MLMRANYLLSYLVSVSLFILIVSIFVSLFKEISFTGIYESLTDYYLINIIKFTIYEALISSVLVLILGFLLARALHRNPKFFGREILIKFFGIAFIMPVIAIVFGLIIVHGTHGWVNQILNLFGVYPDNYIYGLKGILIAHLVFNLPFAAKIILNSLESIPNEFWRIASQLGMSSRNIFFVIEYPLIKQTIIKTFGLIFILCFTSFSVVLNLGGSVKFTTLEVAIYQALKNEFDLHNAVILSFIQFVICNIFLLFINHFTSSVINSPSEKNKFCRPDGSNCLTKFLDFLVIYFSMILIVAPLIAIIVRGINFSFINIVTSENFRKAFLGSITIAVPSGLLSLVFASSLMCVHYHLKNIMHKSVIADKIINSINIILCIPPFIVLTSLVIIFGNNINVFEYPKTIVVFVNGITMLPFILNNVMPHLSSISKEYLRLSQSVNIKAYNFIRYVIWPEIRQSLGFSLAISISLCCGSYSIISLLGTENASSLPSLLYYKLNNFQVEEAASVSLCLLITSYSLFWITEKSVGRGKC